ncbi:hypothetical protein OG897_06130 [Streptomyces sp. NBC_00237]|uniref:hypothetical protein n=1 Tax=Streptomyces sp. NBC_00237 TaxID=2975687 RepID=UPI0022543F73|nr:hypothetical protein [Streptomyces sp. NBC_00237]MCX5201039.1 hypothetical protein [Streptomyces sp. NBC_00237]
MPIAVVRAERYYMPPPREPKDVWDDVPAAERVFKWIEYRMGRRVVVPEGPAEQTYFARINQNRWLVDCVCGSAQIGAPTDPRAGCTECGLGWCMVIYPDDVVTVEAEMMQQPLPHLRNWWHADDPKNPVPPVIVGEQ